VNYVVRVRHVFTWLVVAHRCWELGLVVGVGVSGWVGSRKGYDGTGRGGWGYHRE
jgi:hypothetical protein